VPDALPQDVERMQTRTLPGRPDLNWAASGPLIAL
jgi:hypothetical protein